MVKFLKVNISRREGVFENIRYLPDVANLVNRFSGKLFDDFFASDIDPIEALISLIERASPYFWAITSSGGVFKGFVYLDDWQGSPQNPYCATVTTCFVPKYWGGLTKYAGKRFVNYVFKRLKLRKLKAEVYQDNKYAVTLLKKIGFKHEYTMLSETIVNKKPVNIDVYSIIKE